MVYVVINGKVSSTDAIYSLQQLAKDKKIQNYSINVLEDHSLETGLQGFVWKYNPDMVALLYQGKGKLHNLIYGSKTGEVIKEIEVPVFVTKSR